MKKSISERAKKRNLKVRFDFLIIVIDGSSIMLLQSDFESRDNEESLIARLQAARNIEVHFLQGAICWSNATRVNLFVTLLIPARIDFVDKKKRAKCLLDAMLAMDRSKFTASRETKWFEAVCEVIAVHYRHDLDIPCSKVAELGIKGITASTVRKKTKQIVDDLEGECQRENIAGSVTLRETIANLPDSVPGNLVMPPGWTLRDDMIHRDGSSENPDAPIGLIIITGIRRDTAGEIYVSLIWPWNDEWRERTVPRALIADARQIIALAAHSAQVTSNDARMVVAFLQDFERANVRNIEEGIISSHLGWQGTDGEQGFLLGRKLIRADDTTTPEVEFGGNDVGQHQFADGYRASGDFVGWKDAVKEVAEYPVVMFCFYAGLAAPLLKPLGVSNFLVDLSGQTSTGKSIALRIAMSAWGLCDDSEASIFRSFKGTDVWRERGPAVCSDLPFALDETKHAERPDQVKAFVYLITQGKTKGRGTPTGTQEMRAFRTIGFLTGEQPAVSFTEDGGTRVRTLTIRAKPFGEASKKTGELLDRVQEQIRGHYGHAGRALVEYIVNQSAYRSKWERRFRKRLDNLNSRAKGNNYARRVAPYLALIQFTATLAHEVLDLPWAYADPVDSLYDELTREASQADRASEALRSVVQYAATHPMEFYNPHVRENAQSRFQEWSGIWPRRDNGKVPADDGTLVEPRTWDYIALTESALNTILAERGFVMTEIVHAWHQRGWLQVSAESGEKGKKRRKLRVSVQGQRIDVTAITWNAYQYVLENTD